MAVRVLDQEESVDEGWRQDPGREELLTMERALIGSTFGGKRYARWVVANVPRNAFILPAHVMIFDAVCDLTKDSVELDEVNVRMWMQLKGSLEKAGGVDYLTVVMENALLHSNYRDYAGTVVDAYARRQIKKRALDLLDQPADTPVGELKAKCFDIGRSLDGQGTDTLLSSQVDTEAVESLLPQMPTGIRALDRITDGGYYGGEMNLVIGERGLGKTSWMVMGACTAAKQKQKVGYATLEMPAVHLQRRMEQFVSGWGKRPSISGQCIAEFEAGKDEVQAYDIRWYDPSNDRGADRTIERLIAWAVDVHDSIGIDVLFVDYGQKLYTTRKGENRTRELDFVADELEWVAKRLRIPVIVASQLTQDASGKTPGRSKDCIRFEDNAALVLYLQRNRETGASKCQVGKNRHGIEETVDLKFDPIRIRYSEIGDGTMGAPATHEPRESKHQPILPVEKEYDPFEDEN